MVQEVTTGGIDGAEVQRGTNFCLLAIWALTWASTLVGSCTASVPSTLIRLEIRTEENESK